MPDCGIVRWQSRFRARSVGAETIERVGRLHQNFDNGTRLTQSIDGTTKMIARHVKGRTCSRSGFEAHIRRC